MIQEVTPIYVASEGLTLDTYLLRALIVIKARMQELTIRRDLTPAELLGNFCTELRRQLFPVHSQNTSSQPSMMSTYRWADSREWLKPFVLNTHSYALKAGNKLTFNGKDEHMTIERMQTICTQALDTPEEVAEVSLRLSALDRQLEFFTQKGLEAARLNRDAARLLEETTTFAAQLGDSQ